MTDHDNARGWLVIESPSTAFRKMAPPRSRWHRALDLIMDSASYFAHFWLPPIILLALIAVSAVLVLVALRP